MHIVVSRIHERDGSARSAPCEVAHCRARRLGAKLSAIALAEFVESARLVAEPATQLVARGDVLQPVVEVGVGLAQAPWPQALDEDAITIAARGGFVGTFHPDHLITGLR
jgi:hypothetical protein